MKTVRVVLVEASPDDVERVTEALRCAGYDPVVERARGAGEPKSSAESEGQSVQAQLLLSDRLASVGMLAAGVAHEINNPLAAVTANLDLATARVIELGKKVGQATIEELDAEIRDAREASERVRHIVRDLKVFSRGDEDRRAPIDVRRVLDSTLRMAWSQIRHRARVVKRYEPVPPVEASESRLGQVFLNLIVNAAQAIREGNVEANEIRVSTRTDERGRVSVEIADSGCGIPDDIRNRIFSPFFTTKPVGVGSGLGLSICHRIVTTLGGEIEVESTVGAGTRFTIYLPATREPAAAQPLRETPSLPAHSERAGSRRSVLAVDDEPMILTVIRRALSRDNDVTTTGEPLKALELLRQGARFDVILCDLMMPDMTGMDLHAEIGRLAPEQAGRMVFMTGGAFTARARAFLDGIPNPSLEKPFDARSLRALVAAPVS